MREAAFIKKNEERWRGYHNILNQGQVAPDQLADIFVRLTDDLSYARTYYPQSPNTAVLNSMAAQVHQAIYKNKKEPLSRVLSFWLVELPLLFRSAHRELLISFSVFMLAVMVGVISTLYDESYVRLIMGDDYVNMTLANIEKGDPMAVYKSTGEVNMFLGITLNNVMVSFRTFVYGVLTSLGTAFVLVSNGIMLGSFQCFFYKHGLLWESFLTIWIHGTLEISAIIIAGAAGMVMGNGFLFPGTYSRLDSFRISARKSVKIIIGLVPVFVVAGFLESFVTRYTEMPDAMQLLIIGGSAFFILYYFIFYPIRLSRQLAYNKENELRFQETDKDRQPDNLHQSRKIEFRHVRDFGAKINLTFEFLRQNTGNLSQSVFMVVVPMLALLSLLVLLVNQIFALDIPVLAGNYSPLKAMDMYSSMSMFMIGLLLYVPLIIASTSSVVISYMQLYIERYTGNPFALDELSSGVVLRRALKNYPAMLILHLALILVMGLITMFFLYLSAITGLPFINIFAAIPLLYLAVAASLMLPARLLEKSSLLHSVQRSFALLRNNWWQTLGLLTVTFIIIIIVNGLLQLPAVMYLATMNALEKLQQSNPFEDPIYVSLLMLGLIASHFLFSIVLICSGVQYFDLVERREAPGLIERLRYLGTDRAEDEDF